LINDIDPYNVSNFFYSGSIELWPQIEFPDITTYLLFSTSSYTKEQLRAYKSLDANTDFGAGWVRCIFVGKATHQDSHRKRRFFPQEVMQQSKTLFTTWVSYTT